MKLWVLCSAVFALAACSPATNTPTAVPMSEAYAPQGATTTASHACPDVPVDANAGYHARTCRIDGVNQSFNVRYAEEPAGATGGEVSVDAMGAQARVLQTLTETNVSEYLSPLVTDVDGDGAEDMMIARESGNVNVNYAFWRNVRGRYVRMGELSGVEFKRTADGLLAVPARSGAADWSVYFYRVSDTAMTPVVTIDVHAEGDDQGHVTSQTCTISEAPGLAALHMTRAAAQTKFCTEPVARVFD